VAARRHEAPRVSGCALGWRQGRNGSGIEFGRCGPGVGWTGRARWRLWMVLGRGTRALGGCHHDGTDADRLPPPAAHV